METDKILVWNKFIRIFHVSLGLFFVSAFITGDDFIILHEISGYIVFILIIVRLIYACFTKNKYAHISSFFHSYKDLKSFILSAYNGKYIRYIGHNPLASLVMLALMASIMFSAISGAIGYALEEELGLLSYILQDDYKTGKLLLDIHEILSNIALFLVGCHLVGVIFGSIKTKENLAKSMFITGKKRK